MARNAAGNQAGAAPTIVLVSNSVAAAAVVWLEDALSSGASGAGGGGDGRTWINGNPAPFSGALAQLTPAVERAMRKVHERANSKRAETERDSLIGELKEVPAQIKILSGLPPICALCKRTRDHQTGWQPLEAYLQQHSEATLTHELCPECAQKIPPAALGGHQPGF